MRRIQLVSWLLTVTAFNSVEGFVGFSPKSLTKNAKTLHLSAPVEGEARTSASLNDSKTPDMKAFANGYKTVFDELTFKACTPSVGKVPADLVGSYFRSGPAMFSAGSIVPPKTSIVQPKQPPVPDGQDPDRMVLHPFEGDGGMLGVTFSSDGAVSARYRYIRTAGFTLERKKGSRSYKGMDNTRSIPPAEAGAGLGNDLPLPLFRHHLEPGLNKRRKNTSNTRAVYWGKRLLSMWEGGQPFKLDGRSVDAEGRSRLGGAIRRDDDPFGGKMVYDSNYNRALFYGIEHGTKKSELALYEFDEEFKLIQPDGRKYIDLPGLALITDFAVTRNYAVVLQPDIVANGMQYMMSKDPGKTLSLGNGPGMLHLIPRAEAKYAEFQTIRVPLDGLSEANAQFVNAYEDGSTIVVDLIRSDGTTVSESRQPGSWPWGSSLEEYQSRASKKSLWRYLVDTSKGTITKQLMLDQHGFFGTVNPAYSARKHQYIYMSVGGLGSKVAPPQGVAKFDTETSEVDAWMPEPYEFCGEPMFAPKKGTQGDKEDDGYILSVLFNGKEEESELIIFDASEISKGPITRIPLGIAVPHGLFGCFAADESAVWSAEEIERRAKLANKIESRGNMWNEVKSDFSGLGLRFDDMEEYFGDFFL